MKRLLLIALLWCGPAYAEMVEVKEPVADAVVLEPGQTRVFRLPEGVTTISTPVENLVEIIPRTDQIFAFRGIAPGKADVVARSSDGRVIQRIQVRVGLTSLIKIYRRDVSDYYGYQCNEIGCSKSDREYPRVIETITRLDNTGGAVTTTVPRY